MIIGAKITGEQADFCLSRNRGGPRYTTAYPITAEDLVEFGRSPARWHERPDAPPDEDPSTDLVVKALLLGGNGLGYRFVPPPETYQSKRMACPGCGSESPAKVCRKCRKERVTEFVDKPWNAASPTCKEWEVQTQRRGFTCIPRTRWLAASGIKERLLCHPDSGGFLDGGRKLLRIEGTWVNPATSGETPVRALIDAEGQAGGPWSGYVGTVCLTADANPAAWAKTVVYRGLHIHCALAHELYQQATGETVKGHLWLLAERREPHLLGRRLCGPDLLELGRVACQQLLTRYEECVASDDWPDFDQAGEGHLARWSPTYAEPWMCQAGAGNPGYWALDNAKAATHEQHQPAEERA